MSETAIHHNPKCGTSRSTLAMIHNSGAEPKVIHYLETPPRRNELVALIAAMGVPIRDVLRQKETPYDDLDLGNPKWSDNELIEFMMQHLILINRTIVETPMETRLCRPSEVVLEL